jgi:hypothetical protein
MSEAAVDTAVDAGQETVDPFVTKAQAAGWRPLEEFDGDPEQWVDAKEFVKRAPLYEKNHKLKKEVADLKTTLHEVKGHITRVSEAAYKKAVADLTAQRDEAIDNGDRTAVKELDKQIKEAEAIKVPADNVHPAIKAWEAENGDWFYKDEEISGFGLAYAQSYLTRKPGDFAGAMDAMETAIKKAYPDKFEKPAERRKTPPAVESGSRSEGKKTFSKADLNDEQRNVMNRFVRQGVMSEEEYIKELADSGILGGKK